MEAILTAVEEQEKVNSDLAKQIMTDAKKRDDFIQIIRDLAYWAFLKDREAQ